MIKCLVLNQLKMIPKNVKNHSNCASGITSEWHHCVAVTGCLGHKRRLAFVSGVHLDLVVPGESI